MRNLIVRTVSGIAFIIIMIAAILWGPLPYAVLMCLIIAAMMNEYLNLSIGKKYIVHKALAITAGITFFILLMLIRQYGINPAYLIITALPLTGIFIANLYIKQFNRHEIVSTPHGGKARINNGYELFPFVVTSFIYVALPISMCNFIVFEPVGHAVSETGSCLPAPYSGWILLAMFIILWATDVGAYCFGSTLGQKKGKKLFPSVSPKKSWAGFWGGLLCAVTAGIILHYTTLLPIGIAATIGLAIIICIFGVWGDLAESQLKRNFGAKDSGNIMPGHGGMLDRFDGALIAFPVAIIYLFILI